MNKQEAIKWLEEILPTFKEGSKAWEVTTMAIEALSADAVQGTGRYENAMRKLREMPRYLNGVKAKQIKKTSAFMKGGTENDRDK